MLGIKNCDLRFLVHDNLDQKLRIDIIKTLLRGSDRNVGKLVRDYFASLAMTSLLMIFAQLVSDHTYTHMNISNILIGTGILLALVGLFLKYGPKIRPFLLPGDIFVQKENVTFYFPIVTSIVLSIVLTILINVFRK